MASFTSLTVASGASWSVWVRSAQQLDQQPSAGQRADSDWRFDHGSHSDGHRAMLGQLSSRQHGLAGITSGLPT